MPIDKQLPIEGSDVLHGVNSGMHVEGGIQAQLSNPQDITAASEFFKGGMAPSADKFLPPMDATSLAAPGVVPGAEQMSPLIQMIMKMPGHISLIGNFFDMLGAFFSPVGDALGDALNGLGEGLGLDMHAMGGEDLSLDLDGGGDDSALSLDMDGGDSAINSDLLPKDAPIFENLSAKPFNEASGLFDGNPSLADRFSSAPGLDVGGNYSPGKSLFETGNNNLNFAPGSAEFGGGGGNFGGPNTYVAMGPQVDPNGNFGSTIGAGGNFGLPQAQYQQMQYQQGQYQQAPSGYGDANFSKVPDAPGPETQGQLNGGDATANGGDATAGDASANADAGDASAEPQTEQYTVKTGDNLWDIAKSHLGDGARWPEIYHLNEGVIGSNPSLIMPGTELQLPGSDGTANIASDYTVKPGDNLWDISKEHLGGGQHWGDLYKENASTIGSNPDLIHPGDKLHMPDGSGGGAEHLASNSGQHVSHAAGHSAGHGNQISHAPNHVSHANHVNHANQISHANHASPAHQANNIAHSKGADAGLSKQAAAFDKVASFDKVAASHAAPVDQAALTAKATPDLQQNLQQKIITPENDLENLSLSAKAQALDSGT